MSAGAAIFVKTPGHSPIKTRLAESIGKEKAEAFHVASANRVALALSQSKNLKVYWAVAEKSAMGSTYWKTHPHLFQGEGDLGDRLHQIYFELLQKHAIAFLLGADSPELSPTHLEEASNVLRSKDYVLGPARDGGFYLFAGKKSLPHVFWKSIPYSKSDTGQVLIEQIQHYGTLGVISPLSDVDTLADLKALDLPDFLF